MTRKKKTRFGTEVRSIRIDNQSSKAVWWLATLEKGRFQVFEYLSGKKTLSKVFETSPTIFKEKTFKRLRDSPGRSFESFSWSQGGHGTGPARHSYSSRTSPREKVRFEILRTGSLFLEKASKEKRFDRLAIFASPHTRGAFKKMIGPKLTRKVELEKNSPGFYLSPHEVKKKLISLIPLEDEEAPRFFPRASGTHLMKRFEPLERREK